MFICYFVTHKVNIEKKKNRDDTDRDETVLLMWNLIHYFFNIRYNVTSFNAQSISMLQMLAILFCN